jgi:hypothetical protein
MQQQDTKTIRQQTKKPGKKRLTDCFPPDFLTEFSGFLGSEKSSTKKACRQKLHKKPRGNTVFL